MLVRRHLTHTVICIIGISDGFAGPNEAGRLLLPLSLLRSKVPTLSESDRPADVRNLSLSFLGLHSEDLGTIAANLEAMNLSSLSTRHVIARLTTSSTAHSNRQERPKRKPIRRYPSSP